jgi:glycosyltransferase involved in cell wall biosynthesis
MAAKRARSAAGEFRVSAQTVTILLPTYNRCDRLRRALRSITEQTFKDVLVVVCDNASTDGTREMVLNSVQDDPRIRYFRHDHNIGMINNINFAVSKIETPFFGFLADDDYFLPHFIEQAMRPFQVHPQIQISIMGAPTVTETGELIRDQLAQWPKEGLYGPGESIFIAARGNHPILTGCLFRAEVLRDFHFEEEIGPAADVPILLKLLAKHWSFVSKDIGLYFVRHEASAGHRGSHNIQALVTSYALIEETLAADTAISADIKSELQSVFAANVNRLYLAWLVQSLARSDQQLARGIYAALKGRRARQGVLMAFAFLTIFRFAGGASTISHLLSLRTRLRAAR